MFWAGYSIWGAISKNRSRKVDSFSRFFVCVIKSMWYSLRDLTIFFCQISPTCYLWRQAPVTFSAQTWQGCTRVERIIHQVICVRNRINSVSCTTQRLRRRTDHDNYNHHNTHASTNYVLNDISTQCPYIVDTAQRQHKTN